MRKSVLVTGGAARVGRVIAIHLARVGWDVAVHYRSSHKEIVQTLEEIRSYKVRAVAVQGELTEEGIPSRLFEQVAEAFGHPLTALVNNAAILERGGLVELSREQWRRMTETNLLAPLLLTQAFARQLPKEQQGAIVNVLDGCEGLCLSPKFLAYTLSKYGLRDATRLLAQELAPRIRVNAVSPGLTLPKPGEESMFERLITATPLATTTQPEEVAHAIRFLLETPSVTGQVIALDAGMGLR